MLSDTSLYTMKIIFEKRQLVILSVRPQYSTQRHHFKILTCTRVTYLSARLQGYSV